MMKTRYFILSSIALMGLATSCGDFLETSLDLNRTSETIATNRGTIWDYARAFYSPMYYGFATIDNNIFASASDEAVQTSPSSDVIYFNKGIVNSSVNPLFKYYNNYYEGIRSANNFLSFVADGKGDELLKLNRNIITDAVNYQRDIQSMHWYIAEAHVARAYYYSQLIKMFGGVPIIEHTQNESGNAMVARSSYDECVEYIIKEIDDWKDELAVDWKEFATYEGRINLGVALAIKSRTLLYAASPLHNPEGDWKKWKRAADAANEFISNADLSYSLDDSYDAYFRGGNSLTSPETIFAVRRAASNTMEVNNYPIATQGGKSGVCPSQNLVDAYEYIGAADPANPYANKDPRLAASVVYNGSTWNGRTIAEAAGESDDMSNSNASLTGYYLKKFLTDNLNLTQGQTAQHNWVEFRYAEILLNYAEAVNEAFGPQTVPSGYPMSAKAALQMVRDRASLSLPALNSTNPDSFRAAVKHERRIELAFEDHRYWDLLRWKDAMTVLNQPVQGVKVTKDGDAYSYETVNVSSRTFNEKNYYLPFLRSEIENSNGTLKQNPYF